MASLRNELLQRTLPPLPKLGPSSSGPKRVKREFTPLSWEGYFTSAKDILVGEDKVFRVYQTGLESSGPVVLLLHGGGHSGLSWALFAKHLQEHCTCRLVAVDLRGHGDSRSGEDYNMSKDSMLHDIESVFTALFGDEHPPVVLIGHSMGGALAIHLAAGSILPSVVGLIAIDVVEGTAMESLGHMQTFLRNRPQDFTSLEQAIEWHVRSGQIKNLESARVSVPKQVKQVRMSDNSVSSFKAPQKLCTVQESAIAEQPATEGPSTTTKHSDDNQGKAERYTWRVDLSKTACYWKEWFKDISRKFLSCSVPRMLMLAGVDRLDKELTIGHMQGMFQFHVMSNCGHIVHEDSPDKAAEIIGKFLIRNKFSEPKEGLSHGLSV